MMRFRRKHWETSFQKGPRQSSWPHPAPKKNWNDLSVSGADLGVVRVIQSNPLKSETQVFLQYFFL